MSKEKISLILLKIIQVGVLVILFLPLVMHSQFFFPFIVVKNVLFRIAVEIIFAVYLVLAWHDRRYRPKFNLLAYAVVGFLAISLLAGALGIGFYRSFWGNYERMSGLFHQLHLVLYFFVLYNTFKRREDWHTLFTFSIFASSLMSLLGLAQWLQIPFLLPSSGGDRLSGSVGNATFFATYLLFNLFFILYLWVKEQRFDLKLFTWSYLVFDVFLVVSGLLSRGFSQSDWGLFNWLKVPLLNSALQYPKLIAPFVLLQALIFTIWFLRTRPQMVRILLSVLFLFEFFIFFETQTRGALIGFFVSVVFLTIVGLVTPKATKPIKMASAALLAIAIIFPIALVAAKHTPVVKSNATLGRLATISIADITTESRLLAWQASWKGWQETPKSLLIGYGPENYYYAFNKNFPAKIFRDQGSQIWFDRAHNIIFDVGVTTGLVGLAAYLGILGLAIYYLVTVFRQGGSVSETWLFVGFLVAYFIQNFFVFDTVNSEVLFYLLLAFVSYLWLNRGDRQPDHETERHLGRQEINQYYLALPLAAVVVIGGLFINVKTLQANNYIFKGVTNKGSVEQSVTYLRQSIDQAVVGTFEAREQLATYVLGLRDNKNITEARLRQLIDQVIIEFQQSIKEEPQNVRHYLSLAAVYDGTASLDPRRVDLAIGLLNQALPLSPTRPQIYFELGQASLLKGSIDQAVTYFQQGVDQAPWVGDSQWVMLTVGILTKNQAIIDHQFEVLAGMKWKPNAEHQQRAINVAIQVKNYQLAIELYGKLIAIQPTAENYASVAALDAKIGDNQKARDAVAEAVKLNPDFAAESEKFLKLLDQGALLEK